MGQQFGLYQLGGFSGLILVSVVSCWVGWRLAELGWLQMDGLVHVALSQASHGSCEKEWKHSRPLEAQTQN